jgi:hypothetical protein
MLLNCVRVHQASTLQATYCQRRLLLRLLHFQINFLRLCRVASRQFSSRIERNFIHPESKVARQAETQTKSRLVKQL